MSSAFIELRDSPAAASERGVWMAKWPAVVAIVGILCVGNDERGGRDGDIVYYYSCHSNCTQKQFP